MPHYRISKHPILEPLPGREVPFTWNGQPLSAREGEMISSALFANGVRIFGHHPKDGAPQGIFCANGQCAQCMVLVDGAPLKACMTPIADQMDIYPMDGLPVLPPLQPDARYGQISTMDIPVLIIGGGPSGMSAAIELAEQNIPLILVDDKNRLGGKLVLQTHRFFGSINAVFAGTRGIDIARKLENKVRSLPAVDIWLDSTALAVFSDQKVGILKDNHEYVLVKPQVLLSASGAREKNLCFRGNTLPGVYGAGAFQTLVNRDLVKPAERLFIVGGGNVGLIAGYHALQAGIQVVGLVEALPQCGGYKVHQDKLARMGVPIYTSHTILSANGSDQVESVTIARVDDAFQPIPGTDQSFACDTILIAVGLDPVNEFALKAKEYDMQVFSAGDSEEIAEASSAMFSGKIKGLEIARLLHAAHEPVPEDWYRTAEILKSHPGKVEDLPQTHPEDGVFPIFHCSQEIPCNPCTSVCPQGLIEIDPDDIRKLPVFLGRQVKKTCIGCERCVTVCPGLAITLVDYRKTKDHPGQAMVTLAHEYLPESIQTGDMVTVLDVNGGILGLAPVESVRSIRKNDHTLLVKLRAPLSIARLIAGIQVQQPWVSEAMPDIPAHIEDDAIVCRCERVTAAELRSLIRQGYRDLNELKIITRAGMGACGSKTCHALLLRLFREEGIDLTKVTDQVKRPLFVEVPLGAFAGFKEVKS